MHGGRFLLLQGAQEIDGTVAEHSPHRSKRQFLAVTVATEVTQQEMGEAIMADSRNGFRRGGVREMPVARLDALLDGPGTLGVVLEELLIVVRLDQKTIHSAQRFSNESRGMTEVGEEAKGIGPLPDHESDRLYGIVWNQEGADSRSFQGKITAAFKDLPSVEVEDFIAENRGCLTITIDRGGMLFRPLGETLGVITMFMSHQNGAEVARFHAA